MNRFNFFALYLIALSGCVSTSNLFQDGKTSGKGEWTGGGSVSYSMTPLIETDSVTKKVKYKPYKLPAPWIQLQAQYGLVERLDVGGSIGLGLFSMGVQGFSKLALLSNENKLGISIFGLAGVAGLNEGEIFDADGATALYYNFLGALPVSYDLNEKNALVLQPMIGWENYSYKIPDEDDVHRGKLHTTSYKLGLGYIRKKTAKESGVHYNVAFSYDPDYKKIFPTVGVALVGR